MVAYVLTVSRTFVKMVQLHVKHGITSQFLFETTVNANTAEIIKDVVAIYNGRLKVERVCAEIENLADHGILLPYEMQGLNEDQIEELHLVDEWEEKCSPSGGFEVKKDPIGRRNGRAPTEKMATILKKTTSEAKAAISKKVIDAGISVTQMTIGNALASLRGAVMIVYPMDLPDYDPIRMELENREDLTGLQASLEVVDASTAELWIAGKELLRNKKLEDYVGRNEKTKVIVKLQKKGQGPPGREPIFTEDEKKEMMMHAFRKQEEMKKLHEDQDDSYLNSDWADGQTLKRAFQGVNNISWRPR